jgi:hypothetical protein
MNKARHAGLDPAFVLARQKPGLRVEPAMTSQ